MARHYSPFRESWGELHKVEYGFLCSAQLAAHVRQRGMVKQPFAAFAIRSQPVQILARIALNHIANLHGLIIIIGWLRPLWVETPMTNCLAALEGQTQRWSHENIDACSRSIDEHEENWNKSFQIDF